MTVVYVFVAIFIFVIYFMFISFFGSLLNIGLTFLLYKLLRGFFNIKYAVFVCLVFSFLLAANIRIVDYFYDVVSSGENVVFSNEEKIKLNFRDKVSFSANADEISYKRNLMEFPSKKFSGASMSSYYSVPAVSKEVFRDSVLNKGLVVSTDSNEKVSILVDVKSDGYLINTTYTLKNNGKVVFKKHYRIRKMYSGESEYFGKRESGFFDMLINYSFWSETLSVSPVFLNKEATFYKFLDETISVKKEIKRPVASEVRLLDSSQYAGDEFRRNYWRVEDVTHCDGFDILKRVVDIRGSLGDELFAIDNHHVVIPVDTFQTNKINLVSCKDEHFFIVDFFDWEHDRIEINEYDSKGNIIARYAYDLTELKQYGGVSFVYFEGLEEKFIVGFSAHEADEAKKQLYFELPRKNK